MRNTRTNQGGSVLAFIVVGAVLAIAVVGGVYLTHQRGEEASKGGSSSPTDKKPTTTTQPTTTSPTTGSSGSTTRQPQTGVSPNSTSRIPATGHDSSADPAATNGSTKLPVTGPVDTMLQIVAAAVLTAAVIAYVQSKLARTPVVSR